MQTLANRKILFLALSLSLSCLLGQPRLNAVEIEKGDTAQESVAIDYAAPTTSFPHIWEHMFGSGRAILSLRESYRNDLRLVKNVADVRYVRFHNIFHDEVGIYDEDKDGKPIYNWSYVDQIYDGLLENNVRPFVELSFMPNKLAATPPTIHSFWYKPNVTPPKNWQKWADLNTAFVSHLVERYGLEEVSKWYFEVWNEPDIEFWAGDPKEETYYKLYDFAARAVKKVSPRLKVGGPACAMNKWIEKFIQHCYDKQIPLDFVTAHTYASGDEAEDPKGKIWPEPDVLVNNFKSFQDRVKKSQLPNLPIIWSEYNACWANNVDVTDSTFMGPWLAYTMNQTAGLTDEMSFWTFSDVFEEQGVVSSPFYGGFGLIAAGSIPKPAFNAFKMLHALGTEKFALSSNSALVTKKPDGSLALLVWNYTPARKKGTKKSFDIAITNMPKARTARISILDRNHASSLSAWLAMGKPNFPSREQQKKLRDAAVMPPPEVRALDPNKPSLSLQLDEQALALIEVSD